MFDPSDKKDVMNSAESNADVELIREALRCVVDPELHMNIVDLGLIYEVETVEGHVNVRMTLTTPGCPYGPYILHEVDSAVKAVSGVRDVNIEVVWDPPWGPERMTEEARLELGFDI